MSRYKEVQSAGKKRPLLIYDERIDVLAPLHKLLYKVLRSKTWLLCGPPTEERMSSVLVNSHQTSVDLVAATDGLAHDVSHAILDSLFFTSVKIPRSVRELAHRSLDPMFLDSGGELKRVRHGQMQGGYLSFPLLCIHSFLAASWATRDCVGARILVNGDDCVISAEREITVQDYPKGYRLNNDKTIRAKNVAEVNSTAFLKSGGRWREVRHLRRGGAPSDYKGMLHMADSVSSASPAFVDAYQRARIGRRWGFMPSQLGHWTYPAYKRQQGFLTRISTPLPSGAVADRDERLRCMRGTPTAVEAESLRSFFWVHGRNGHMKRDEFDPSCGRIRRTFRYRAQPYKVRLSFVGWSGPKSSLLRGKRAEIYFVPDEWISEEELEGLALLDLWRQAFGSLVSEQQGIE